MKLTRVKLFLHPPPFSNLILQTNLYGFYLTGVSTNTQAVMYVIDDTHANAYPLWVSMGKPTYLSPRQVDQLKQASELVSQSLPLTSVSDTIVSFTITVPSNSVVNVILVGQ